MEKTRSLARAHPVQVDPLTVWNIFYYFFGNDFQRENEKKIKNNLGNKEKKLKYYKEIMKKNSGNKEGPNGQA